MANEAVRITIGRDGSINAETLGMTGKACVPWIKRVEALTAATTVDSSYTEAYGAEVASQTNQPELELGADDDDR